MNSTSLIKKCPFCRNDIPTDAEICPKCKIPLVERIDRTNKNITSDKNSTNTFHSKKSKNSKNTSKVDKKNYIISIFNLIKHNKIVIALSFVILLLLFFLIQSLFNVSDRVIYQNEINRKNIQKKEDNSGQRDKNSLSYNNELSELDNGKDAFELTDEIQNSKQNNNQIKTIPEKHIPNGQEFYKNKKYFIGLGELIIRNGTDNDALAKLVPKGIGKSVLTIYISKKSDFTIKKIKDGNYNLYFVVGKQFEEDSLIFLQDCSFSVFEEGFHFTTDEYRIEDKIKTEYSIFEITLHPVIGGTASTDAITKKEFLQL